MIPVLIALLLPVLVPVIRRYGVGSLAVAGLATGFYLGADVRVNIALSDVIVPLLVLGYLNRRDRPAPVILHVRQRIGLYWWTALIIYSTNALVALVTKEVFSVSAWTLSLGKFAVGVAYCAIFFTLFAEAFLAGDYRLLRVWAVTAELSAALGICGYVLYGLGVRTFLVDGPRATAFFEDPNAYAGYLVISIPVVVASRYTRRTSTPWWSLPLLIGAVLASESRSGAVALVAVALALAVCKFTSPVLRRGKRRALAIGVPLVSAWLLLGAPDFQRRRPGAVTNDVRFSLWSAALRMWQDHPFTGVGFGQFPVDVLKYVPYLPNPLLAHNSFLSLLAEGGIVAFAGLLAYPVSLFVDLARSRTDLTRLVACTLVALFVQAFSVNLLNTRYYWVALSLAAAVLTLRSAPFGSSHARARADRPSSVVVPPGRGLVPRVVPP